MTRLIDGKTTDTRASISRSLRHKLIKEGNFPRPVKIGARRIAFVEAEIEEWIASRISASRTGSTA